MPLACLSCRHPLTAGEIVRGALSSVPAEGLVDFRCAKCGERGLARLSDGLAEMGRLSDGAFKVLSFQVVPDLAVTPRRKGALTIWHAGEQRDVPAVLDPGTPHGRPAA